MPFELNRFHLLALVAWQFCIFFATQNIFAIFSNYVPQWRCDGGPISRNCDVFRTCGGNIQFVNPVFHSAAIEFSWVCAKAYHQSLFSQVQYLGVLMGTVVFGSFSDRLGRKPVGIFVLTLGILSNFLSGYASSGELLIFIRLYVGLAVGGVLVVVCTWIMELLLPQQRMVLRGFFNWGWARIMLTMICMKFRNWRTASHVTALTTLPALLLVVFVLPESPTWLHNKGKLEKMRKVEKRIMRIAGVPYEPVQHKQLPENQGLCDVLQKRALLRRLPVLWLLWFVASVCSFATDLNSNKISGDLYINQFAFGIMIAISKIILVLVDRGFKNFKRRYLHQGSQIVVCICFVVLSCMTIFGYDGIGVLAVNLVGTVFMEYTWDACYLCAIESVETGCRATATGTCSFMARVGAIFAPFLVYANIWWSASVFVAVSILGTINLIVSYLFMVETKDLDLDEICLDDEEESERECERRRVIRRISLE